MTLLAKPNPHPLAQALRDEDDVATERNLECPVYGSCLHHVVKRGWDGWTCRACANRQVTSDGGGADRYARAQQPMQDIL